MISRSFAIWMLCGILGQQGWAEEWEPAKTRAVIVGVLEWENGLTPYPKRNRKDQELRDTLIARGTPAENVELLLDKEATLVNIRQAIRKASTQADTETTLIVYFAGHGWSVHDDYHFANYDVDPSKRETAWSMNELGEALAETFRGQQAFFWADCCYSGGLEVVVDALQTKQISSFSLTSASTTNASTNNWTFTQSILDGLRGEPLVDLDGNGRITLGELSSEVRDAMRHLEGQSHGFKASGLDEQFVMAKANGSRPNTQKEQMPRGSYVQAGDRWGRIVDKQGDTYYVQFYNYCDKIIEEFAAKDLIVSTRNISLESLPLDSGVIPDCEVEWHGSWWAATILNEENDRWKIHYVGYDDSWNEWVGKDRIRWTNGRQRPAMPTR